jgi:DNA-3-methyladenine glycosylase
VKRSTVTSSPSGVFGSGTLPALHLGHDFFRRDPIVCARELIGCELFWGECTGLIVETEAYCAVGDEASHAFFRPSTRRFMADHPPGTAYVYLNYGIHWLLNVLVKGNENLEETPENGIVLIRALEPLAGIDLMRQRRNQHALTTLCSGPGKLTQAFAITGVDHCRDLCGGKVGFRPRKGPVEVETDLRVGITRSAHLPWRFLLKGSPFVSVNKKN